MSKQSGVEKSIMGFCRQINRNAIPGPLDRWLHWLALVCAVGLGGSPNGMAGGPSLRFAKLAGLALDKFDAPVASDSRGNIYLGGYATNALVKYDPEGNKLWAIGAKSDVQNSLSIVGVSVDGMDNVYALGASHGSIQLGSVLLTGSPFLCKFTTAGVLEYVKFLKGMEVYTPELTTAADGDLLMLAASYSWAKASYDGVDLNVPEGGRAGLAFKVKSDGSLAARSVVVGDRDDFLHSVSFALDGDMLLAGSTVARVIQNGGIRLTNSNQKLQYLFKTNPTGLGKWAKGVASAYDGDDLSVGFGSVTFSPAMNAIYWAGDFVNRLEISSPSIASSGAKDAFVAKLGLDGTTLWARTIGGPGNQWADAAIVDEDGNVFVAGFYTGELDCGLLSLPNFGNRDIFVIKLLSDGTPHWAKRIGWTGNDISIKLDRTRGGELLVGGKVEGGISVDGVFLETANLHEAFLLKFNPESMPPRIHKHPRSQTVPIGKGFTLSMELEVADAGAQIQWWLDGERVEGGTNQVLTIPSGQQEHAGNYHVVATNEFGSTQSERATVTLSGKTTVELRLDNALTLEGIPGRTYRIEYSTSDKFPAAWTVATNLTLEGSKEVWSDPAAVNGEVRRYRVLLLDPGEGGTP